MGVPTFFRWVSEKYPKITQRCIEEEAVTVGGIPIPIDATQPNPNGMEFDNLYLDMNGIIHPCTHPEDGSGPLTLEMMFIAIGKHIDRLFCLVRPRKLVYMAIDGIAPRAKMNQQRSRRFRSALEADEARADQEKVRKSMKSKGYKVPNEPENSFDSNVITPGTEFMDRLAEYLRYFIIERQANDPAWASCKVILSDAQSPGEGEHKIMQFVRRQRAEKGHNPDCHHIMYGLDADLIMLGLASHEVRFTVLRDVVLFGKQNRKGGVKQDQVLTNTDGGGGSDSPPLPPLSTSKLKPIEMLHVWILREYLQHEFRPESFEGPLSFPYDFERCIDDFVFLCFFVGNDFLPHLPSLSIREGGLELLFNCYRKVIPTLSGFLTEDGDVHLDRVDAFMKILAPIEDRIFQMRKAQEEREKNRKAQINSQLNKGQESNSAVAASRNAKRARQEMSQLPPTFNPADLSPLGHEQNPIKPPPPSSTTQNKSAAAALKAQMMEEKKKLEEQQQQAKVSASKEEVEEDEEEDELFVEGDEEVIAERKRKKQEEKDKEAEILEDESLSFEDRVKKLRERRNMVPEDQIKDEIRLGETGWKERYYITKFGEEDGKDPKFIRKVVESYVRGLCWVIQYYYKGCQSWKWFFEFHYAPFASDLTDLASIDMSWPSSRPFKPFEQLMAVLPPQSATALPEPCRWYMTEEDSEIADFYPRTIQFDPDGKPVRWLWIALLPFIEESRLLEVTKRCEKDFNEDEKRRNAMMPDLLFVPKNAVGFETIRKVLTKSPPNLLHNWESDQLAILKNSSSETKLFEDALNLPAPTTAGDARGGGSDDIYLSAPQGGGISGFFLPVAPEFSVSIGDNVMNKIHSTQVVSHSFVCEFRLPPLLPHLSKLCDNVTIPEKVLTTEDLQIRRPRLSGLDISTLLADNSATSSGLEKSWGSLEPERIIKNKRINPFLQGTRSEQYPNYPPPLLPGQNSTYPPPQYYAPPPSLGSYSQQQQPPSLSSSSILSQLQSTLNQHQASWNNNQERNDPRYNNNQPSSNYYDDRGRYERQDNYSRYPQDSRYPQQQQGSRYPQDSRYPPQQQDSRYPPNNSQYPPQQDSRYPQDSRYSQQDSRYDPKYPHGYQQQRRN